MTTDHSGFLATSEQMLFLRACMQEPQESLAAWKSWRGQHALSDLNVAQRNLLPLLYHNLQAAGYTEPEDMDLLSQSYQESRNRVEGLWQSFEQVYNALQHSGVSPLLLKGMAFGMLCYPDRNTRRMADMDVIVPFDQAEQAIVALQDAGWVSEETLERWSRRNFHACTFHNAQKQRLDLHWHLFAGSRDDDDEILWKRAEPLDTDAGEILTLSIADHLFHCCIHGYAWSPLHPMRWIVDAHMLYRHARGRIDWLCLVEQAKARRMTLRLLKALEILHQKEVLVVPDTALNALRSVPVAPWEQAEHDLITSAPPSGSGLGYEKMRLLKLAWFRHRRYCRGHSLLSCVWTFPPVLSKEMCLENVWQLPWGLVRIISGIRAAKT